jgi:serine/threonine protein phosphatase PrpC
MQVLRRLFGLRESTEEAGESPTQPPAPPSPANSNQQPDVEQLADVNTKPLKEPASDTADTSGDTRPLSESAVADTRTAPLRPVDVDGRTRQLPPLETIITQTSGQMLVGQQTHEGRVRENNQDSMFTMLARLSSSEPKPGFGLFIVADGMGGHEGGEKASSMTARIVAESMMNQIFLPVLTEGLSGDAERPTVSDALKLSVQKANEMIATHVPEGGTTLTATAIMGNQAYIAHVGDSRAYLIYEDNIEQITRDHSLVERLRELGQLTPEEALEYNQKNVLYRAVGQSENLDVDAIFRQTPPGSYILLCSDGLWNLVSDDEILQVVLNHSENVQTACEQLVAMANERGGTDNITVVLVRIPNA